VTAHLFSVSPAENERTRQPLDPCCSRLELCSDRAFHVAGPSAVERGAVSLRCDRGTRFRPPGDRVDVSGQDEPGGLLAAEANDQVLLRDAAMAAGLHGHLPAQCSRLLGQQAHEWVR